MIFLLIFFIFRPYWRSYYPNTNAIIYVVDSVDKERLETCKQELIYLLDVNINKSSKSKYILNIKIKGRRIKECTIIMFCK